MLCSFVKRRRAVALAAVTALVTQAGAASISEIFFDPPGSDVDSSGESVEYIELFGTASASLDDHWLVFVENENNSQQGKVEAFFDLSGMSFGTNGYSLLLPKGSPVTGAAGSNVYKNSGTAGNGYGVGLLGSTIGFTAQSSSDGDIENSGFTALLIEAADFGDIAPSIDLAIDTNNDLVPDSGLGWTIHDGIGVVAEEDDVLGSKYYADVVFSVEDPSGDPILSSQAPSGAGIVNATDLEGNNDLTEIEWLGRQGVETAIDEASWIAANLKSGSSADEFVVAKNPGAAVLGGTAGSHWSRGFVVTNTYGSANHTPEPGSCVLVALGGLLVTAASRRR